MITIFIVVNLMSIYAEGHVSNTTKQLQTSNALLKNGCNSATMLSTTVSSHCHVFLENICY